MAEVKFVESRTLKEWVDAGQVELIDVRNLDEHEAINIPGSKLRPLGWLSINDISHASNPKVKLVLYCRSGKRSMMGCQNLISEGLSKDAWNLTGGIISWVAEGLIVQGKGIKS